MGSSRHTTIGRRTFQEHGLDETEDTHFFARTSSPVAASLPLIGLPLGCSRSELPAAREALAILEVTHLAHRRTPFTGNTHRGTP